MTGGITGWTVGRMIYDLTDRWLDGVSDGWINSWVVVRL